MYKFQTGENMKTTINKIPILILALIVGGWSHSARADQPIGLIQTLCIPEPGIDYFSARLESFNEIANYIHRGHKEATAEDKKARLQTLEKYGLIFPDEFSYTCKLEHHTYTITGHRPPFREKGMCGGDPRVTITLKRDDDVILDDVFFEQSCFSDVFPDPHGYVELFSVEDGSSAHGEYIDATVSDGTKEKIFHFSGDFKSLNHDQLSCLEQNNFFKRKGRFVVQQKQLEPYEHCGLQDHHHGGE